VQALELPEVLRDARLDGEALIVVSKSTRRLARYSGGALVQLEGAPACWTIGLAASTDGAAWSGTKTRQGDRKTPEGWYRTSDKPWSSFYAAIAVHYPDRADADAGLSGGRIDTATHQRISAALETGRKPPQSTPLGGEILIHGGGGDSDWTLGCVALDDADIDALRGSLPPHMQTDVLILP
jgi:murein L,D-transpeptidase YafK